MKTNFATHQKYFSEICSLATCPIRLGLLALVFILQLGCATERDGSKLFLNSKHGRCLRETLRANTKPYEIVEPQQLSSPLRAELGKVGVVSTAAVPSFEYQGPLSKSKTVAHGILYGVGGGAVIGALGGALGMGAAYAGSDRAADFLIDVSLITTGMTTGGAIGALTLGVSATKNKKAEVTFTKAVAEQDIQRDLRDRVTKLLEKNFRFRSEVIEEPFMLAGDTVGSRQRELGRVDTLLDIKIKRVSVAALEAPHAPLMLVVPVHIRLVRVRDGLVLYEGYLQYDSKPHRLKDWSEGNGEAFRAELDRCSQALAEKIAELF